MPDPAPTLVCDRRLLGQALTNIVKNGVEAIEQKREERKRGKAATADRVAIAIRERGDQGHRSRSPTPASACRPSAARLTEPYMTTRAKGTGLGLAIVKKIVEEHFGQIEFEDGAGGGSLVRHDLRRGRPSPSSPARPRDTSEEYRRNRLKYMALDILIVDDEQDIRELVSGVLEDEGFATRVAGISDEALQALADRRPSLLLLDVWLQGSKLDGLQLLEEVKRRDPTLPVLMISGHGNLDTAVAAIRQGAVDFIEKPFEAGHLVHLVSRATETERLRRENEALQAAGRQRDGADRLERRDQQRPRDAEAGGGDRQPGADLRARPGSARRSRRGCSTIGARAPRRRSSSSPRRG